MTEYEILKGRSRRLDRAIEKAEKQKNASLLVELIDIRDGARYGNKYQGSNLARHITVGYP
jgi:hypothetical protein